LRFNREKGLDMNGEEAQQLIVQLKRIAEALETIAINTRHIH